MKIIKEVSTLKKAIENCKKTGSVGLVPTMGALHEGHISLVERCRKECDTVVVSIFVNPTQFNDSNDLKNYPRTEQEDIELLEKAGCNIVFMPSVEEIYPKKDTRVFDFGDLEKVMEGANRPGHFNGVGQIVSKLFEYTSPNKAYFGEKDFQQLAIIRKMTKDLNLDIEIVGCEICRAEDFLALSSRNMLLTKQQRAAAPTIYKTISQAALRTWQNAADAQQWVISEIEKEKLIEVEYFTIANEETLQPLKQWDSNEPKRGFIVAKLGKVRLIDNIKF